MDAEFLQRAYAKLELEEKKKKKKTTKKQERLVIRGKQAKDDKNLIRANESRERSRRLRTQYESSAMGILEAFGKEIAPAFQRMMAEHGDKLTGSRLMLMCSKGDYSGAHAIVCMSSPRSKMTLHKSELEAIVRRTDEVKEANIAPEPATVAEEEDDDRLEKFASTPNDAGHYPSDEACDEFEATVAGEAHDGGC